MDNKNLFKVNTPNIVHETIDGETILLNLKTGNYYSFDGIGASIWNYIDKTGSWYRTVELITDTDPAEKESITNSIKDFVSKLLEEELLRKADQVEKENEVDLEETEKELKNASPGFKAPVLNKYSDMQDLLLLDPIHDVDEGGWPEVKDE